MFTFQLINNLVTFIQISIHFSKTKSNSGYNEKIAIRHDQLTAGGLNLSIFEGRSAISGIGSLFGRTIKAAICSVITRRRVSLEI